MTDAATVRSTDKTMRTKRSNGQRSNAQRCSRAYGTLGGHAKQRAKLTTTKCGVPVRNRSRALRPHAFSRIALSGQPARGIDDDIRARQHLSRGQSRPDPQHKRAALVQEQARECRYSVLETNLG